MNATQDGRWLPGGVDPRVGMRIFCFPHAGGGAASFHGWRANAGPGLAVCPVRLPGRETRLSEPAFRDLSTLVAAVHGVLRPHIERPFVLYGHSMGALIAYELARHLRRQGSPLPERVVVSGRVAPHLPAERPPVHTLSDGDLLRELRRLGATPEEVLDSQELIELMLPSLRADFAVCETYRHRSEPPLPVPLLAAGGLDDPEVQREALAAWGEHTEAAFTCEMFPGDHFFPYQTKAGFFPALLDRLEAARSESRPWG